MSNTTVSAAGCNPTSLLTGIVIVTIILVAMAAVTEPTPDNSGTNSPLAVPAVAGDSPGLQPAAAAPQGQSGQQPAALSAPVDGGAIDCAKGCLIDNQCGESRSIIARYDPVAGTRYYYPPDHQGYSSIRNGDTQGYTTYYFCTAAQAEANNWTRAP